MVLQELIMDQEHQRPPQDILVMVEDAQKGLRVEKGGQNAVKNENENENICNIAIQNR
jgi:hypothetical protein